MGYVVSLLCRLCLSVGILYFKNQPPVIVLLYRLLLHNNVRRVTILSLLVSFLKMLFTDVNNFWETYFD
jgi:ABC-type polysaccharide/polyol phosphate export permease